ncbi:MAG: hypothetical protein OXG56_12045 [Gammaproteobacteria bacterium]|nr:hypothetical protein [Gammaproteobacteria bacterium]
MMVRNQTIFRVRKTRDFVAISRITLEDARLSWDARGLHAFLLAKPDDWETCIQHLVQCSPAGRDRVRRILQELIRFHYIIKIEQPRTEKGQYARPQYLVHESPQDSHCDPCLSTVTEKPSTVYPSTDKPLTANPTQLNIHNNKESQDNKKQLPKTWPGRKTWTRRTGPPFWRCPAIPM